MKRVKSKKNMVKKEGKVNRGGKEEAKFLLCSGVSSTSLASLPHYWWTTIKRRVEGGQREGLALHR